MLLLPVIDALELLPGTDGPVDGIGVYAQFGLHLAAELQRVPAVTVHLINKGKNRNMPQGADPEELPCLRFHALCRVDDHHRGIRRHQGPVGVLGEVLMPRGVQDVDAAAVVLELHHGRRNRNTPLLLDFHPVRRSRPRPLALDLSRLGDGSAVEQEFFRQGGFACVGMGDDRKCPPAGDFFFQSSHILPPCCSRGPIYHSFFGFARLSTDESVCIHQKPRISYILPGLRRNWKESFKTVRFQKGHRKKPVVQ